MNSAVDEVKICSMPEIAVKIWQFLSISEMHNNKILRISGRALTSTEVAGLYNGTKSEHLLWYSVPG